MSPIISPSEDSEADLAEVIEEFTKRVQAGETVHVESYIQKYPAHAERLRQLLPSLGRLAEFSMSPVAEGAEWDGMQVALSGVQGDFRILREVGKGGMGVVYEAEQQSLQRRVALKVLPSAVALDPQRLLRFHIEAATAAMLDHPNIVPIYEVGQWKTNGTDSPLPYFSMKLIEGGNLAQKLVGEPWPPWEAARFVEILSHAVGHAHRHGVIHRDLKPANILVTAEGAPLIADFGLAKHLDRAGPTLTSQTILGTPLYMAPEQAAGQMKLVGPHTDVHALGAILYELLIGRPPFRGATTLETLEQVRSLEPVPPTRLQPKVPRDLEAVCLKCLQKEPAQRYANGQALAEDLGRFLAGQPTQARPANIFSLALLWCRRPERVRDAGAFMTFLGLVLTLWCLWNLVLCAAGVLHFGPSSLFVGWVVLWISAVYVPMVWLGRKIIQRRLAALWAGLVVTLCFLVAVLSSQFYSTTIVDEMYRRGESTRIAAESLLIILAGIQVFACVVALSAYYANRRAMRWFVADAKDKHDSVEMSTQTERG